MGLPVRSKILLVGQAPGIKEPVMQKPFAWTAGKTLFKWIESATGWQEDEARKQIYFAAVCRCFPGKNEKGGDRVPTSEEISNCARWLKTEMEILRPALVLAVGKLAISQFMPVGKLSEVVGDVRDIKYEGHSFSLLALPHPSGASTWHRTEPGKTLLLRALDILKNHPAVLAARER
ncbi:MAG: uracil-DNA glycosylase family protein [Chthoniobacterales bacterium]